MDREPAVHSVQHNEMDTYQAVDITHNQVALRPLGMAFIAYVYTAQLLTSTMVKLNHDGSLLNSSLPGHGASSSGVHATGLIITKSVWEARRRADTAPAILEMQLLSTYGHAPLALLGCYNTVRMKLEVDGHFLKFGSPA